MDDEIHERHLNIHFTPEIMAGVYANFANVSHSDYEFTITFARVDHEVDDDEVPGVVVSRVNLSPRFMRELIDAMQDNYSKWSARERIRELPETEGPRRGRGPEDEEEEDSRSSRAGAAHRRGRPRPRAAAGGGRRVRARLGRALRLEVVEVREEPLQQGTVEPRCRSASAAAWSRTSRAGRWSASTAPGARYDSEGLAAMLREREERPPQRTACCSAGRPASPRGCCSARRRGSRWGR